jgi:GH25 family lysozyme M1 (1,4-beta-N-acetylmuramidase)
MLDMEYNPSGSACYGLSASAMVNWISDFVETYKSSQGVYPLLYTSTSWWTQCTGNSAAFGNKTPLVIARYSSSVGTLPAGWSVYSFWQFNDSYQYGGDSQTFNGSLDQLKKIAKG